MYWCDALIKSEELLRKPVYLTVCSVYHMFNGWWNWVVQTISNIIRLMIPMTVHA